MQIETQRPQFRDLQQIRRAHDKNIQNVFSDILVAAGREGFESAEFVDLPSTMPERIENSWNQWYQTERLGRYASPEAPQDLGKTFGDLLRKAYDEGAYVDPISFLKSLSTSELKTVQSVHWLADSIRPDSLTEEGALNLLIPPAAQVDLNRDGLTQSGAAYGIRFPDSTTPSEVVAAWDIATADLSFVDRMHYELQMKLPVLLSNIVTHSDGSVPKSRSPGDPDFVNPLAVDGYSYLKATQDWINHLDYFKNQMDPTRYANDRSFWSQFHGELSKRGAT